LLEITNAPRPLICDQASGLEVAEHLLAQAATGERDLDRLNVSVFNKLMIN
jgi:hypothetical protein